MTSGRDELESTILTEMAAAAPEPEHVPNEISNGRWMARLDDPQASERHRLQCTRLSDGAQWGTDDVGAAVGFVPDTETDTETGTNALVFVALDERGRPAQVRRVHLDSGADELLFEERDPGRWVSLDFTRSGRFLVLTSQSLTTAEVWLLDLGRAEPRLVHTGGPCSVEHLVASGGREWLLLLEGGKVRGAMLASDGTLGDVRTLRFEPGVVVESLDPRANHLAMAVRHNGYRHAAVGEVDSVVAGLETGHPVPVRVVEFGRDEVTVELGDDPWETPVVTGTVQSLVQPPTAWSYEGGEVRVEAASTPHRQVGLRVGDAGIPVTIAFAPGADPRRPEPGSPLVLAVYGAYGVPYEPRYSVGTESLLRRGVSLAIAHVRGGGELGPPWHRAATGTSKVVSIDDYLAVVDHLVRDGWVESGAIVAQGSSAGGLVVGAALNRAPEHCAGAVLHVPLVNPMATLLDPDSPLTDIEVGEWGDLRRDPRARAALAAIAPLEGVREGARYPPVFVTAAAHDFRVPAQHVAEWVEALRAAGADVTFHLDADAGHEGSDGRREFARELAWTLEVLDKR